MSVPTSSEEIKDVASLDDALRSMTFEGGQGREAVNANENSKPAVSPVPTSSTDHTALPYRPNSLITVHRKQYAPQYSDSSSESDLELLHDEHAPTASGPHGQPIGNYINVGHQNWLALRQEWKKRPIDWIPKRKLNLDSQTICDRITTSGVLSERSDEGVPLPEVVRVMVQVWEREGVN